MLIANSLVGDSERFREMTDGQRVLDFLEERFRTFGASHFLASGLPLPGRPIEPLVLRQNWGELRGPIDPSDAMFQLALRNRRTFAWFGSSSSEGGLADSMLARLVGQPGRVSIVAVPIHAFPPYQGCIIAGGLSLTMTSRTMLAIDLFCIEGFRRLLELAVISTDRPGDLSARERKVVELSAVGKTASEIAGVLDISQRTVHAHLQNASGKLHASNKTHTVVEALRYGQISV